MDGGFNKWFYSFGCQLEKNYGLVVLNGLKFIFDIISRFFKQETVEIAPPTDLNESEFKFKGYENLENLNPQFADSLEAFINFCNENGLKVGLFHGFRSIKKQNDLFAKGRTKPGKKVTNARGGSSWHNYGVAGDVVFITESGNWSWAESHPWDELGDYGKTFDLEWGGDWTRFKDRPHFQMTNGLKISEAKKYNKHGGLDAVWSAIERLRDK